MRYPKLTIISFFLFQSIIIGCNSNKNSENWDLENTRNVKVGDANYSKAIDDARKNLPVFFEFLKHKQSNKFNFYIKSKYSEGERIEHLWFIVDSVKGRNLICVLDNVPLNLKSIKLNDTLSINTEEIEDWIVYKRDSIIAGSYISKIIQ